MEAEKPLQNKGFQLPFLFWFEPVGVGGLPPFFAQKFPQDRTRTEQKEKNLD